MLHNASLILYCLMSSISNNNRWSIVYHGKVNGDSAVVYPEYLDAWGLNKDYTFSAITEYDPAANYFYKDMVLHNKQVYKCIYEISIVQGIEPGTNESVWDLTEINNAGFGISAQKRFKVALDNFANLFLAAYDVDRNILRYSTPKNDRNYRKPTFCTLTIPVKQSMSDADIKAKIFDRWMESVVRGSDVKLYVWRAEAQLNGNIHFHIVFDKFLDQKKLKKNWYNALKDHNMVNTKMSYEEHSRIVWIQELPKIELIKHELAGYFATEEDEEGNLYYKHRDKETGEKVYVRKIEGRSWGYSDKLKYRPFTLAFMNQYPDTFDYISDNCLFHKEIKTDEDKKLADLYIYRQIVHKQGSKPYVWENKMNEWLLKRMYIYHAAYAYKYYSAYPMDKHIWDITFDSGQLEVYHDWKNAEGRNDYEKYKYTKI